MYRPLPLAMSERVQAPPPRTVARSSPDEATRNPGSPTHVLSIRESSRHAPRPPGYALRAPPGLPRADVEGSRGGVGCHEVARSSPGEATRNPGLPAYGRSIRESSRHAFVPPGYALRAPPGLPRADVEDSGGRVSLDGHVEHRGPWLDVARVQRSETRDPQLSFEARLPASRGRVSRVTRCALHPGYPVRTLRARGGRVSLGCHGVARSSPGGTARQRSIAGSAGAAW